MDVRWTAGNLGRMRIFAKELMQPDTILVHSTPVTAALLRPTRTIPTLFVLVGDPIGDRFVAGLASPGGNIISRRDLRSVTRCNLTQLKIFATEPALAPLPLEQWNQT